MATDLTGADVAVVGGGVIGLATGWRLALDGATVAIIDPAPGQGASSAAAGMLAPVTGPGDANPPLRDLSLSAAAGYPAFVEQLEDTAGLEVGYRRCGTLSVASDSSGDDALGSLVTRLDAAGIVGEWLDESEARTLEPALAPDLGRALWIGSDHQVDSGRLVAALETACRRAGVQMMPSAAVSIQTDRGGVTAVELDDGRRMPADAVVVAYGCASATLPGIPPGSVPVLTPVLGEVVQLSGAGSTPGPTVRRHRDGPSTYVVPSRGGYVVGATVRTGQETASATAGGVLELLQSALEFMPALADLALTGTMTGVRSATSDRLPVIGPTATAGLFVSTGHLHKGILLAPLSAELIRVALAGEKPSPLAEAVAPYRFLREGSTHG